VIESTQPDTLAALLRAAGRRPEPPAEVREHVLAASRIAWRRAVALRRRRRITWALAASVLVAAGGLSLWSIHPARTMQPIATLDLSLGAIEVFDSKAEQWITPHDDTKLLTAGTRLRTRDGAKVALRLADGAVLRVAPSTELTLAQPHRVELLRGTLYAHNRGQRPVVIATPLGTVIDVGTQFEVHVDGASLRTRVRSGSVRLETEGGVPVYCNAGEQLSLESGRSPAIAPFAPADDYWSWMAPLTSPPSIEGLPLRTFLTWAAEELGRSLRFATPAIEARAEQVRLHGSVDDLTPLQALDIVLAGTSLSYVLPDDGTMLVTAR